MKRCLAPGDDSRKGNTAHCMLTWLCTSVISLCPRMCVCVCVRAYVCVRVYVRVYTVGFRPQRTATPSYRN